MLKKFLLAGAAAALLVSQADPADALAIRVIYDGVLQYQVDDNEATVGEADSSAIIGHLQHNNTVGVFALGTASVLSSVAFGAVDYSSLGTTVHATTVSPSAGTHTLEILASDNGFNAPDASVLWALLSDFGVSTFDDSFLIETYLDFNDNLFGTQMLVHSGNQSTPNVEDPINFIIPANLNETPFAITHRIRVQHTNQGESLLTNRTTITSEPEIIALFGLGLLGAAYSARRRKSA